MGEAFYGKQPKKAIEKDHNSKTGCMDSQVTNITCKICQMLSMLGLKKYNIPFWSSFSQIYLIQQELQWYVKLKQAM